MPTLNPDIVQRVSSFFSEEADALRSHLAPALENDHSDLWFLADTTAECIANFLERLPALTEAEDTFIRYKKVFQMAEKEIPALTDDLDWGQATEIQLDWNTNNESFFDRFQELVTAIKVYGIDPSSESLTAFATSTHYSTLDVHARDMVIKQVFHPDNAHLMYWDISLNLKGIGLCAGATRTLIKLEGEKRARLSFAANETERAIIEKDISVLNQAIAELPTPNVSPLRFNAFQRAVDSFSKERVAKLFA